MFSSNILDIVVTLGFTFLLLALIVTTVTEIINTILQKRSVYLRQGLKALFDNIENNKDKTKETPIFKYVIGSPFIKILTREPGWTVQQLAKCRLFNLDDAKFPSYISPNALALAVIDVLGIKKLDTIDYTKIKEKIESLSLTDIKKNENKESNDKVKNAKDKKPKDKKAEEEEAKEKEANVRKIKDLLITILDNSVGNKKEFVLNNFTAGIEKTFNDCMDRATGLYKRKTQWITFIVSAIVVLLINVDTLKIVKTLQSDKDLLQNAVTIATNTYSQFDPKEYGDSLTKSESDDMTSLEVKSGDTSEVLLSINKKKNDIDVILKKLNETKLPIGWDATPKWNDLWNLITISILGWLISIIAIYLGAPFWFDVLNKVTNLRGAGVKPVDTKSNEGDGKEKK